MHASTSLQSLDQGNSQLQSDSPHDSQQAPCADTHSHQLPNQAHAPCSMQQGSGDKIADLQTCATRAEALGAVQNCPSASHKESELEAKLTELTHRLSAAEQAAGHHSEIKEQLLQLKEDKSALQDDLKQFMQHTSSVLTILQANMSRLMLSGSSSRSSLTAENSHASVASIGLPQGFPEPVIAARPPLEGGDAHSKGSDASWKGSDEAVSPVAMPQARSSLHDWQVESHGNQPSPLARHEIFQSIASPVQAVRPPSSLGGQPGQLGSWLAELPLQLQDSNQKVHALLDPFGRSNYTKSPTQRCYMLLVHVVY